MKSLFSILLIAIPVASHSVTFSEIKKSAPVQVPDSHRGLYVLPGGGIEAKVRIDDTTNGKWGNKPRAQYRLSPFYPDHCRHCIGQTWIYDFTITIPSDNYGLDKEPRWDNNPAWNIFELHSVPDGGWKSPIENTSRAVCLGLNVAGYQLEWIHGFDKEKISDTQQTPQTLLVQPIIADALDHWRVEYKVDPIFSQGLIKIWRNGTQVLDYHGLTCTNDDIGPYALFGVYVWKWSELPNEPGIRHVIFHDFSMYRKP